MFRQLIFLLVVVVVVVGLIVAEGVVFVVRDARKKDKQARKRFTRTSGYLSTLWLYIKYHTRIVAKKKICTCTGQYTRQAKVHV